MINRTAFILCLFSVLVYVGCSEDRADTSPETTTTSSATTHSATTTATTSSTTHPPQTSAIFDPETTFVDVHMHCNDVEDDLCLFTPAWDEVVRAGGRGALLSIEHWAVTIGPEELEAIRASGEEFPIAPEDLNELYERSARDNPNTAFFASLECWHDTPFGPNWTQACKDDAARWVAQGAIGFKDHAGKHWDGAGDFGIFAGGWSRHNGWCQDLPFATTPNQDCANSPNVKYPLLENAWRDVVAYIVSELKQPIITHASTWYGADSTCFDHHTQNLRACADLSRDHLLDFAQWAKETLSPNDRKRIIIAHSGFMVPGEIHVPRPEDSEAQANERIRARDALLTQLDTMLSTGVSMDTAVTKDFVAMTYQNEGRGGCELRTLFARYPDQLLFGTDRSPSNGSCLIAHYQLWNALLTGPTGTLSETFGTCIGALRTYGLDLDTPQVEGCPDVPKNVLDKVLLTNFTSLYTKD